ncbi:glycosyltransferase family 4 protein [Leptolyngbya sp. BC1307]|uniref:glycosyltransferase family 4 protein n=1 Tax=Leptolyngbya sp. BC1307 TaxID=2029589 RepID=UPI000EFBAA62|nr:glycosyltransferase family 4 protein [Leptolyngbya sp. BC1307]
MRILIAHNFYQQGGGEDNIFATEVDMLESYGHYVKRFTVNNNEIEKTHPLSLAKNTVWNNKIYKELRSIIRDEKIQIAHFHNTFPLFSPSSYYAAKAEGIPVVQTLHNYRLLCPNALFFREGRVCEDCLGSRLKLPSIIHGCYRGDRIATSAVATMVGVHSLIGTWANAVDIFIAYSQFTIDKLVQGGIPSKKIEFKTNFLYPVPEIGQGKGKYALFVGRLSPEKGTNTLLTAWKQLNNDIPLKIVGDGPSADDVARESEQMDGVEWLGKKSLAEVYELMGDAAFFVFCSEWYETFGRVAIESYAKGTPVVAAKIGAITELVDHKRTGMHFRAGDAEDLVKQVRWLLKHPQELAHMRVEARAKFDRNFTANKNYQRLMEIYESVMFQTAQK